jgi:hypothetical protein
MVELTSVICPICGRNKGQILFAKITRWSLSCGLLVWICYEIAIKHHLLHRG